ncbi:MAG: metallophosphoesterase [Synergistaceae bacterium]|jgi:predicted MPP superfamily phosphohydrolase|nr:metallophosphoesterase [Synergistaceae bacterium]
MFNAAFAVFIVSNLYFYLRMRAELGAWWKLHAAIAIFGAALPLMLRLRLFGTSRAAEVMFALSFTWLIVIGMICVGFFAADAIALMLRPFGVVPGVGTRAKIVLPIVALLFCYSVFETYDIRRVSVTIETPLPLPEGGVRLVLLTDLHIGGLNTMGRLRKIMDIVREAKPDLLLVGGDTVDGDMGARDDAAQLLGSGGAKYGSFAVTGNHDFYTGVDKAVAFMRRAGLTVLRGERVNGVAGIDVIGLDDPTVRGRGFNAEELRPPDLDMARHGRFVVLLKHRPRVLDWTKGYFDLQLSGHTHGGQLWPFGHLVERINGSVQGLSRVSNSEASGGAYVYVSNGTGFWGPPMRFLTPPEVTVIDLKESTKK